MRFVKLNDARGIEVFVNPLSVRYVAPGTGGNGIIHFADEHSLACQEAASVVASKLEEGLAR